MEVGGKKRIDAQLPVRKPVDEAQRSAEIQLPASSLPVLQGVPVPAPLGQLKVDELAQRGKSRDVGALLELSHPDAATAQHRRVDQMVIGLSAGQLSPEAQQRFVASLERELGDQPAELCRVKNQLWRLVRRAGSINRDLDLSTLSAYFRGKGLRLLPNEPLPGVQSGLQVDRGAFRAELREAIADGVLKRSDALSLIEKLREVEDPEDLLWCQLQLSLLHQKGKFVFADGKTERQVKRFFSGRLDGHTSLAEVGYSLHRLRRDGFDDAGIAALREQLNRNESNPEALFYVKRQLRAELNKAIKQAEKLPPAEQLEALAKIQKAKAALLPEVDAAVVGKYDRYAVEKELGRQHRAGKLSNEQFLALHAAATTSSSYEDFAHNAAAAQIELHLVQMRGAILEAWSRANDEESERKEEEQRRDTELRQLDEKRLEEKRHLEQTLLRRERFEIGSRRGLLTSRKERLLAALAGETNPDRRASLAAALASSDIQLVDLDEPLQR